MNVLDNNYNNELKKIKALIREARHDAINSNKKQVSVYWKIGQTINERKEWGNKFIENLSHDIKQEFKITPGFSVNNLKKMAKFASIYSDFEFVTKTLCDLSWSSNVALMNIMDAEERKWYAEKAAANRWTKTMLIHQVEQGLYQKQSDKDCY